MQPGSSPPSPSPRISGWQFSLRDLLWLLLFIAGWLGIVRGCNTAWLTVGEVRAAGHYLACGLIGPIGLLLCIFTPLRKYIAPLTVVIAMAFAWQQHANIARLRRIEAEVLRLAGFVEQHKRSTGEYPESISDFDFDDPEYAELIRYWPPDSADEGYIVGYDLFVGETFSREYSPRGWYYFPD